MTDGQFFIVDYDQDGNPVNVTPVTGRVDRVDEGYVLCDRWEMTYGTPVMPTQFIPLMSPDELRAEAAATVLVVFRELGVDPSASNAVGASKPSGRMRRLKRGGGEAVRGEVVIERAAIES